jgi:peptide/nickel transport system substrate-binding protein
MSFSRKLLIILLLSMLIFLITGCEPKKDNVKTTENEKPDYGDFLVVATGAEPITLNPIYITDTKSSMVEADIFNGLIKYNSKSEMIGDLAESWEIKKIDNTLFVHINRDSSKKTDDIIQRFRENSRNFNPFREIKKHTHWNDKELSIIEIIYENTVTETEINRWYEFDKDIYFVGYRYEVDFKLRENVKWHDGTKFTASDVEFTYNTIVNPDTGMPYVGKYYSIKSFETTGRFSFKVVYWKPLADLLSPWFQSIIPKHILEDQDIKNTTFSRKPIGTGPYKLEQWNTGESLILTSNHDYFDGRPYIDKYVYKVIPDSSQKFLSLANGQIDYMSFSFDQYKNYNTDSSFQQRFNIFKLTDHTGYTFIGYNNKRPPFDNVNIRKALSLAINIDEIIQGVYYGNATRISGPYRLDSWAYNKEIKPLPYNPENSKELLMKEGYRMNQDGWMEKDGKILEITLMTNNDNKEREHMVKFIKEYWKNIGIKCEYDLKSWSDIDKHEFKGDFDAVLRGWGLGRIPDIYGIWHSSRIPSEETGRANNTIRYTNKEADILLEKIRFTVEEDIRRQMCHKVHELIAKDHPYTFMFAEDYITVVDKRFHGVKVDEDGYITSWLKWYVPQNLIRYK